jgi:hypothetical protein
MFLGVHPIPYNSIWFVEIFARGCILEFLLVKPIMEMAINIVDVVKYISFMMVCSVLVAVWRYECHQLVREIRKG